MRKEWVLCRKCGCILNNYDSKLLKLCTECRPKLPDNYMEEFRKAARMRLGSPTKTSED